MILGRRFPLLIHMAVFARDARFLTHAAWLGSRTFKLLGVSLGLVHMDYKVVEELVCLFVLASFASKARH